MTSRDDHGSGAALVDLVFPVQGDTLARDHRAALAAALLERLSWLGEIAGTGVHDVNVVAGLDAQALLSARSRVTLRIPRERSGAVAAELAGVTLQCDGQALALGPPMVRELLPHRTLYAHFVAAASGDEAQFLADVVAELSALGVEGRPICGRRQQVRGADGPLAGFSLMLDGLSAADASRIMQHGIGPHRQLGCGLFIPHKSAAAVGA